MTPEFSDINIMKKKNTSATSRPNQAPYEKITSYFFPTNLSVVKLWKIDVYECKSTESLVSQHSEKDYSQVKNT